MSEVLRASQKLFRSPHDSSFDFDPYGYACYWNRGYRLIEPAKPITDGELFIGKIGQQNILPGHLTLKKNDLVDTTVCTEAGETIGIVKAGISGFLFFGDQSAGQTARDDIVENYVGKTPHKKTRVHVIQVSDIWEQGWTPFFAPLINCNYGTYNPLHVVMCPNSVLESGVNNDATEAEKERLAKVFVRWSC